VTKETQSSLTGDVRDVEQAGTMQNFIVGHESFNVQRQESLADAKISARLQCVYEGPSEVIYSKLATCDLNCFYYRWLIVTVAVLLRGVSTPCPRKNYNTVYVAITLANNVGF